MKVSIDTKAYNSLERFIGSRINKAADIALQNAEQYISIAMDRYTPMKTGALRNNKTMVLMKKADGVDLSFIYREPYAKYQYENKDGRFKNYTTPGTGDHWADKAAPEINKILRWELLNALGKVFR